MIVTVEAFKGGVGKSTTAYFLAQSWASRGHDTLLIGTSPQNDILSFLSQRHDIHGGLRELLAGRGHGRPLEVTSHLQVLPAGYQTAIDLTPPEVRDSLRRIAHDTGSTRVVIDGWNLVDLVSWGGVAAADLLLVPCTVSPEPARAVHRLWKALQAQRNRPETAGLLPAAARVLLTDVPAPSDRTKGVQRLLDQMLAEWSGALCDTQIRRSASYVDLDVGLDSYSGARRSTRGPMAADYQRLATEVDTILARAAA